MPRRGVTSGVSSAAAPDASTQVPSEHVPRRGATSGHSPDHTDRDHLNFNMTEGSTHLLIGDSTIRGINPYKSGTSRNTIWTKVCIGGLRTEDVPTLLNDIQENSNIKTVILHTGVSDSRTNPVSSKTCLDAIKQIMYKFPTADISVSSVIPTKGKDELGESVRQTNTNMKNVCNRLNVKFINHDASFLSRNGAPKLALYRDKVHPSPKGTAVLASDIFGPPLPSRPNPQMPRNNSEDFPPLHHSNNHALSNQPASHLMNDLNNNEINPHQTPIQGNQQNNPLLSQPLRQATQNGMTHSRLPHPVINPNALYREHLPHLPTYPLNFSQPHFQQPFFPWPYLNPPYANGHPNHPELTPMYPILG